MTIVILVLAALFAWAIVKIVKGIKNNNVIADDNHFKQANVEIVFATGGITINGYSYTVNQVTGISSEANTSNRSGNSMAWNAIISVDDFKKPMHKINFLSRKKANEFTQRLGVALRKAGGPSFA